MTILFRDFTTSFQLMRRSTCLRQLCSVQSCSSCFNSLAHWPVQDGHGEVLCLSGEYLRGIAGGYAPECPMRPRRTLQDVRDRVSVSEYIEVYLGPRILGYYHIGFLLYWDYILFILGVYHGCLVGSYGATQQRSYESSLGTLESIAGPQL